MQSALLFSKIDTIKNCLEAEVAEYIGTKQTITFESFENANLFAFDWFDIKLSPKIMHKILVYINKEHLFIFFDDDAFLPYVSKYLEKGYSNEKALYMIFVHLFQDDINYLENIETEITDIEDFAISNSKQDYLNKIIFYRKELLSLKRYYEQWDMILDNLCANDNGLLTPDGERYMGIISGRVHRFINYVLNLRDYLTQLREAYQAQIDIEQNQIMKVFTVITAIFLPLTLIVGWYGMNFYIPELKWKYGYLYVTALSLLVCIGLFIYFKKKKWFK